MTRGSIQAARRWGSLRSHLPQVWSGVLTMLRVGTHIAVLVEGDDLGVEHQPGLQVEPRQLRVGGGEVAVAP